MISRPNHLTYLLKIQSYSQFDFQFGIGLFRNFCKQIIYTSRIKKRNIRHKNGIIWQGDKRTEKRRTSGIDMYLPESVPTPLFALFDNHCSQISLATELFLADLSIFTQRKSTLIYCNFFSPMINFLVSYYVLYSITNFKTQSLLINWSIM